MLVYEIYDTIENKYLEFKSVKDCAEYLNCSISTVSSQMSRNKMVKGHKLEYINKI